jgi:hypothetical protein
VCAVTRLSDTLSDGFHVRPGSPSQKDLRPFSRKLARDGGSDRAPAPNITARFPCSICESLTVSSLEHRVGDLLAFLDLTTRTFDEVGTRHRVFGSSAWLREPLR